MNVRIALRAPIGLGSSGNDTGNGALKLREYTLEQRLSGRAHVADRCSAAAIGGFVAPAGTVCAGVTTA
jgi:hypothetical protein